VLLLATRQTAKRAHRSLWGAWALSVVSCYDVGDAEAGTAVEAGNDQGGSAAGDVLDLLARLASAVETFCAGTGQALNTSERRTLDRCLTPVKRALDKATLARAQRAGMALSLEQAVEAALEALR